MNVKEFYDEDVRRRLSTETAYGRRWRLASDEAALFGLHWIQDTREIYIFRGPQPPLPTGFDARMGVSFTLPLDNDEYGVEVLGWAESEEALEQALDGWEAQMNEPNSLQWVRARLKDAEARTGHQVRP